MIDLIKQALQSPAGSFGFVFSLLVLGFWLVHWVTRKVTIINSSHDGLNKKIDKIESNIDDIKTDMYYLKGSFDIIKRGISPVAQSLSPVSLTKIGIEKSKIINADDMVARNWEKIYDDLEKNIGNKNAYDIQQYCMDTAAMYPNKFLSDADIYFLKTIAYKEGNPLMYYSPIFGIIIRDKYLSIKGIDVSNVDKNDPSKNLAP
jgi:hypothetical protein